MSCNCCVEEERLTRCVLSGEKEGEWEGSSITRSHCLSRISLCQQEEACADLLAPLHKDINRGEDYPHHTRRTFEVASTSFDLEVGVEVEALPLPHLQAPHLQLKQILHS